MEEGRGEKRRVNSGSRGKRENRKETDEINRNR